jgi:hypothetical protein
MHFFTLVTHFYKTPYISFSILQKQLIKIILNSFYKTCHEPPSPTPAVNHHHQQHTPTPATNHHHQHLQRTTITNTCCEPLSPTPAANHPSPAPTHLYPHPSRTTNTNTPTPTPVANNITTAQSQHRSKPISPKPKLTANPKLSSKPINFTTNPSPQTHKFLSHSKTINFTPNSSRQTHQFHTKPITQNPSILRVDAAPKPKAPTAAPPHGQIGHHKHRPLKPITTTNPP